MFYVTDFKTLKNTKISPANKNTFSVILSNKIVKKNISKYSIVVAVKPLILFVSLFGSKMIRYDGNSIFRVKILSKFYSFFVIVAFLILSTVIIRPLSWRDTKTDLPLNILTKTFGTLNIAEAVYSVFATAFLNSECYVELFYKLDNIYNGFDTSEEVFKRRRLISVSLVILPIAQVSCTFWLRKFYIQNIGAHITFFLIMLQGALLCFLIVNIYIKLVMLNILLMKRVVKTISQQKVMIFQDTICDHIVKNIYMEPKVLQENVINCCWFELMQIYDKLADCIYFFNKIYCGQVFTMYNTWLLCTLLIICRSLSPSLKYSELFLSDLFLYTCINSRPIILASMCEMFMRERKKTLALMMHILLSPGRDEAYLDQVKTMIMLVSSRNLEISANVFTVNVPTVMNFAGRIISYTVLMIQYFYSSYNKLS